MKRLLTISGLALVIVLTAVGCRHSLGRMKERSEHFRMRRHMNEMEFRHMGGMGMERGMGPQMFMGREREQMMPGRMGPGLINPDRIPGLTDKQRQEISDLRVKNMEELDKFHEEAFAKLQNIRESQRKAMMNILTDDQKKFLESAPIPGKSDK